MSEYAISVTTWDHGHGHTEALRDGPVKDHLLGLGQQALGYFPEIDQVVFRCKANHSEITIYRKEVT